MVTESTADPIERALGREGADALADWADQLGRAFRLRSPYWSAKGFTGARLAAIIVSDPGAADRQVIVKVCPPGPYRQETGRHHRALSMSLEEFVRDHLVDQVYAPHPTADGGRLMFQDVAGGTLDLLPLSQLPDVDLPGAYEAVVNSIIRRWNPSHTKAVHTTVGGYLRRELGAVIESGGSVRASAERLGLLRADGLYLRDGGGESSIDVPNPLLMMDKEELGAASEIDVVVGLAHGDLHGENVLVPREYGTLRPHNFRLVDLSSFEPDAPVTRDAVMLMLSAIAPHVKELRADEQDALLAYTLSPWAPAPSRLSGLLAQVLEVIHRTGSEAIKAMNLGDWRSQYLLSVIATALRFTSFAAIGDGARWWFLRLSARAGAAFLERHGGYQPVNAVALRRPSAWPSPAPRASAGRVPPNIDERSQAELIELIRGIAPELLRRAFAESVDAPQVVTEPNWQDPGAVVRMLAAQAAPSGQIPWLLVFAEKLAHIRSGTPSLDLHRWLTATGVQAGLTDAALRDLCRTVNRQPLADGEPVEAVSQEMGDAAADLRQSGELQDVLPNRSVNLGGSSVTAPTSSLTPRDLTSPAPRPIRGVLPSKHPDFIGRDELLARLGEKLRRSTSAVPVIAQALHGLGGVGKTQLAIEYIYRHIDEYWLVWWISAEDVTRVRASLAELGERLGLPEGQDMKQATATVLEFLAINPNRWLLVYDNVDGPEGLRGLLPSAGGDVIITSRNNAAWSMHGNAIEVDVFKRGESIELLQRRGHVLSEDDADRLADKLGDLPLALEQAATWRATTGMPVAEYLALFDKHITDLMSEGKPFDYPQTVYANVKLALRRLREEFLAAAELLELFAYLGSEPVSVTLLRAGRNSGLSKDLEAALQRPIELNRAIRELRRFGLAKVESQGQSQGQRIHVHRLIQRVLAQELANEKIKQSRNNVQALLASANPGYPDEKENWPALAEIAPHVRAARLVDADGDAARAVVVDQIRYLFVIGDYEGSRALGEYVVEKWRQSSSGRGRDHEQTLIAQRHLANAYRLLGQTQQARELDTDTFERLRRDPRFGEDHEHTLYTANNLGVGLRLSGDLDAALTVEEENVERHLRVFGDDEEPTWRAKNNLASSLRHLGRFAEARDIDKEVLGRRKQALGIDDSRTLSSMYNLAHDNYGVGDYPEALELLRRAVPLCRDHLGARHSYLLLTSRTLTMALRKCGYYVEARDNARENYRDHHARFGGDHEHTLSATISFANALRCCATADDLKEARGLLRDATDTYRRLFGDDHPLTLVAQVNLAVVLRAFDDRPAAYLIDEAAWATLTRKVGPDHPYTLAAAINLAHDRFLAGDKAGAAELSRETFERSEEVRGADHPDTLGCAINAALDLVEIGDDKGGRLLDRTLERLRQKLGSDHPATLDAVRGVRVAADLEPPPT